MNSESPVLNGLILAGGWSTRMGQDKALLYLRGQPAYLDASERIKNLCDEVLISCREAQISQLPGAKLLPDFSPSSGPITGILTAFRYNSSTAWLVIPVDMPLLTGEFLWQSIVRHRGAAKDATVFRQKSGWTYPLPMIVEPHSVPLLQQSYESGIFSIQKLLNTMDLCSVEIEPDCPELQNLNTMADWKNLGLLHQT